MASSVLFIFLRVVEPCLSHSSGWIDCIQLSVCGVSGTVTKDAGHQKVRPMGWDCDESRTSRLFQGCQFLCRFDQLPCRIELEPRKNYLAAGNFVFHVSANYLSGGYLPGKAIREGLSKILLICLFLPSAHRRSDRSSFGDASAVLAPRSLSI